MKISSICFDIDGTLYAASRMKSNLVRCWLRHPLIFTRYQKMRKDFRVFQAGRDFCSSYLMAEREALVMLGRQDELLCTAAEASEVKADPFVRRAVSDLRKVYETMSREMVKIVPRPGVAETFAMIRNRGLSVGVFSDFPIGGKLEALGLDSLVDFKADSMGCGYLKPDKRCFDYLCECGNIEGDGLLYVGDSFTKDYLGARNAGWNAALVGKGRGQQVFSSWCDFDRWLSAALEE